MSNEPDVGIGHVVLSVSDVQASCDFYSRLGMEPCHTGGGMAILELRGGTHLILLPRRKGDRRNPARVDLMIAGRTKAELEAYRAGLIERGVDAPPIPDDSVYGHYMLRLHDPDGNDVVLATSHSLLTQA